MFQESCFVKFLLRKFAKNQVMTALLLLGVKLLLTLINGLFQHATMVSGEATVKSSATQTVILVKRVM